MSFSNAIVDAKKRQSDSNLRYPAFVALLWQAGVESYTVNVASFATKYAGRKGESHSESGGAPRTVAGAYNGEVLDAAVRASRRGELDDAAFMDKLAASGIASFEARLGDKVIVYEGHGKSYAEAISR
ncbi:MAG: hypothetical protein FD180_1123 [Planctomycetota bacterium]|nr:MAG: hypothetical protein FD180_1123 [Planctomycetota bacterium]